MAVVVDLGVAALIIGIGYVLSNEGLWGAALALFNILFASVIAFNFYEPLATLITSNAGDWSYGYADLVCLTVLFIVTLLVLRLTTDNLGPTMIRFPKIVYNIGRFAFGLAAGMVATSVMLLAFHTAPVHKKLFTVAGYDAKPPFGLAIDRRFLAFFQYTTGYPFSTHSERAPVDAEFGQVRVFDRQGRWLLDHEDARPVGEGWRDAAKSEVAGATGGGAEGEGAAGEGSGSGSGSGLYESSGNGPGIPGGTAGAAAGLAPMNP